MTTRLFSSTFCKLEIFIQTLMAKKNQRRKVGENLKRGKGGGASIHKQGMQFVQLTTQIVQFSSENKAFFPLFFKTFLSFLSAIPLELEHYTNCTVIELFETTHIGL